MLIFPSQPLTTLTPEQITDITDSVRKGQSWHAYQEYKKHKEQLEKLSIELEAARKRISEQGNKVIPVSAELPPANESVLLFDANGEGWLIGWRSLWYTWGQKETGEWQWTFQVGDLENVGLQETVKLASEALSTYGGVVNGDVIIKGILSLIGNELLIEKDNGFSGIHIRNKSTVAGSANGVDFSFGGAIMSSLICGIMENGANYIDVALSPAGNISDRRLIAFTLDGNIRQLIPQNGWSIQGYTKNSDFTQAMADAGWVRFPNGIIFQWCWGNTDASGWASAPFPIGWPVRCFGLLACNVAGDSIASAIAGVKRLNDRDMQVTLMERSGVAVSKPFFCIGVGC